MPFNLNLSKSATLTPSKRSQPNRHERARWSRTVATVKKQPGTFTSRAAANRRRRLRRQTDFKRRAFIRRHAETFAGIAITLIALLLSFPFAIAMIAIITYFTTP